jgi:hypothetical protein
MPARIALLAGLAALLLPAAAAHAAPPSAASLGLEGRGAKALLTDCPDAVRLKAGSARAARGGVTVTARTLAGGDRRYSFALASDLQFCGLDVQRSGTSTRPRAKLTSARRGTYTDLRAGTAKEADAVVVFARPRALPEVDLPTSAATARPFTGAVPDAALRAACPFVLTLDAAAPGQVAPPARKQSLVGVATLAGTPTANRFAFEATDEGELCGAVATYNQDDALSAFAPPLSAGAFETPPIGIDAVGRTAGVQQVSFYARRAYDARP